MKYKLSDICHYVSGKVYVSGLDKSTYISTENMLPNKGGVTEASTLPNIDLTQIYQQHDVLVSNIRPYFKKIWFADQEGGCSNDVLVFRAKEGVDPRFLYYVLADDKFFSHATATSKGTKMPRGDKKSIMEYEVPDFDLDTQKKIASLLGNIDAKITVNSKINKNLDEQARLLFRYWFIDAPESNSWKKGTFSNIIDLMIPGDWGKDTPSGKHTEMVYCIRGADIPEVKAGNKGKMPTRYILPQNYVNKHLVDGDVVVEISGGSPTQSTGRIAAVSQSLLNRYDKGMVCTNFCKALKPRPGYSMFVYYYWQYLYDKNVFFSYENGTTGIKNLDISSFIETEPIVLPPQNLVSKFDSFCQSLFNIIFANGRENEDLAMLRDNLLPQLMTGKLEISVLDL